MTIRHENYLVEHAYNHVWCSPEQDKQFVVAPARVTERRGVKGGLWLHGRYIRTPDTTKVFHVFTFGALPPSYVGMITKREAWIRADVHMQATSLLIELYHNNGVHLPLFNVWFLFTRDNDLVICIENHRAFTSVRNTQIFTRWRSNAWFDGVNGIGYNDGIRTNWHEFAGQNAAFQTFLQSWNNAKARPMGHAYAFVNGIKVREIQAAHLKSGDVVWWVWDGSIKEVTEIAVKDFAAFYSDLDLANKFLYFRAGLGDTIDYRDDVDFYVLNYIQAARYLGVYYHRNQNDSIRNVTHRDYSLKSAYVDGYVQGQAWHYGQDIRIQCVVRHSGWIRPLIDEHHRIKELYKLPEDLRRKAISSDQAMSSDVMADVWTAKSLENSFYPKVMDAMWGKITSEMVQKAYGYNAVSKLIGNAPVRINSGQRWVDVLYGQWCHSTVFEYDTDGRLLGWYPHRKNTQYAVRNAGARYVEAIAGTGGVGLNTQYDTHLNLEQYTLESIRDYRFYVADNVDGIPQNNWKDVTGDNSYYEIVNGKVNWKFVNKDIYNTAIRNDLDFLSYDVEFDTTDDVIILSVKTNEVVKGRVGVEGLMDIPPGEIDVFMNGFDMVPDIDYYLKWPEFGIVNKSHLNADGKQKITIRCRGFCKPDLSLDQPMDSGFIRHGQLSRNARFNLRDDKVTRISVHGQMYLMDELAFAEDGTILDPTIHNGLPYRITHPIIPGLDLVDEDIYAYRRKSMDVDKEVEDYLTEYLPEPVIPGPNPIPMEYPVISLFCMRLIQDMKRGVIDMTPFEGRYTDQEMARVLDNYAWLLEYDPIVNGYSTENCIAHPHQFPGFIELTFYEFQLLDRAIGMYLQNGITLSRYVTIA